MKNPWSLTRGFSPFLPRLPSVPAPSFRLRNQIPQPISGFSLAQAEKRPIPKLTDAFAGDSHHPADLFECTAVSIVEAEIEPQHLGIPGRQRGQGRFDVPGLAVCHRAHIGAFLLTTGEAFDPLVPFT